MLMVRQQQEEPSPAHSTFTNTTSTRQQRRCHVVLVVKSGLFDGKYTNSEDMPLKLLY